MKSLQLLFFLLLFQIVDAQKIVHYDLFVKDTIVNYTGKEVLGIAINGQIPAPTLYFTEGDTADIIVHNELNKETSIHWHGLILPNQYDGVPYLTTSPILKKSTHHYRFPIKQNGTYWYHSHTMLQEQSGMYGAIVIHKKQEEPMKEYVIVLSDWSNEKPYEIHRKLHNGSDWYAIQKGSTQNYFQALKEGYFKTKLKNEYKRMNAMDVSDVFYDKFLINGKEYSESNEFKKGEKVKLRIVNGAASSYFWLKYAGGKMTVTASDGKEVQPFEIDRMIIGVSETYDLIVEIPFENTAFEFLATPEDRTKKASLWLGKGVKQLAEPLPKLKYFEGMKMMNAMMKFSGNMKPMGMQMSNQIMDMNTVMYPEITGSNEKSKKNEQGDFEDSSKSLIDKSGMNSEMNMEMRNDPNDLITLKYTMLKSVEKTSLPILNQRILKFELTGNMNRYVWSIDNKTVSESDRILIKNGENVKIIIYNNSMMRHPMHLHGHFFRLLNGMGEFSPLKNVIDIMPMETDTIEFEATESGDWFFHCHILYHMMSGMGRIFSYQNSPKNPEILNPKQSQRKLFADDRRFHPMSDISLESNGSDGDIMVANTRYFLQTEWRLGVNSHHGYESESHFGRYFGKYQFFSAYFGWDFRYRKSGYYSLESNIFKQKNTKDNRGVLCAGITYVLPFLIKSDLRIDQMGNVRIQLSREGVPLSNRLRLNYMINSDYEYMMGLKYIFTKNFAVSSHYDSDMGYGLGITLNY